MVAEVLAAEEAENEVAADVAAEAVEGGAGVADNAAELRHMISQVTVAVEVVRLATEVNLWVRAQKSRRRESRGW